MKAATSLNAYAESYVPLSKRGGSFNGQKVFKRPDEFIAVGGPPHLWYPAVQAPPIHNIDAAAYYASVNSGLRGHPVHGYGSFSSYNPSYLRDKAAVDEQYRGNSSEKLPDTLDIGDVAESGGVRNELPFQKMKDINIEGGGGSSSSSGVLG